MFKQLLCRIFGHQPPVYSEAGWWSPGNEYGKMSYGALDNVGRQHCMLHANCPRCDTRYLVARFHLKKLNK